MTGKKKPTKRMRDFANARIEGLGPSAAYRRAYSASKMTSQAVATEAARVGRHPWVKQEIKDAQNKDHTNAVMTREEALERLSMMGRANIADLAEFKTVEMIDIDGEKVLQATWRFKDSKDIDPVALAGISKLNAGRDGLKIELHDAKAAIKQLSDMQGWDDAPKGPVGPDGKPVAPVTLVLDPKEYAKIREKMLASGDC